jgi:hypothetical protein
MRWLHQDVDHADEMSCGRFDLFFAVFAPLTVLVYFIATFDFDRAAFAPRLEMLPMGTYDNTARLFGSPSQISSFCSAFHYLQITSASTLFYKSALNFLSLYKWRKITVALMQISGNRSACADVAPATAAASEIVAVKPERSNKRDWPKLLVAGVFLFAGLAIFTYSIVAIDSTHKLCNKYTRCGIASYQWNVGSQHCTCLMFADRQVAPSTFNEWNNPVDTTSHLSELAIAGELRIIQIINRALPEMPVSVRNCKHLEQIILIYTKTERLPEWMTEFSSLEYLYVTASASAFAGVGEF